MKRSVVLLVSVASVVLFAGSGFAQTFDLVFDAPGGTEVAGAPGQVVEVPIDIILTTSDAGVTGMSYSLGASSDGVDFELLANHPIPCDARCIADRDDPIIDGDVFFFQGAPTDPGKEPDSGALAGLGPQGESYVAAIAYNPLSIPPFQLPAGDSIVGKIKLAITIPATPGGTVVVEFRNGHQGPGEPVNNGITFSNATQTPTLGSITITTVVEPAKVDLAFQGDANPGVAVGEREGDLSVTVGLSTELKGDDGVAGWQYSIQHSSNIEVTGTEIAPGLFTAVPDLCEEDDPTDCDVGFEATDFGGDVDPDLIFQQSDPADPACELVVGEAQGNGVTSGVTFALPPDPDLNQELPPNTGGFVDVMVINYRLVDPMPNEPVVVSFNWVNCMKGVGVRLKTGVTVSGKTVKPLSRTDLEITIDPVNKSNFKRHDANNDGEQDLSDAVYVLDFQFFGGEVPACPDAADANNDQKINIADAIEMISVSFRGKAAIPPFVECGTDDESDADSCPPNSSTECNA
jgi:hypothetical protein